MANHEKKQQEIRNLEVQFGARFTHLSENWYAPLVGQFRDADPGRPDSIQPFWDATVTLGRAAMQHVPVVDAQGTVFVCVPRGAYPLAIGAADQYPGIPFIVTDDGAHRSGGPLLPSDVPQQQVGSLIIVDSVLDRGGTLDRTLAALDGRISAQQIIMLTVIAHPPTIERMLQQNALLHVIAADTESNFVPAFVGEGLWLAGFGDIGANVEAHTQQTSQPYLMPPPGWYPDGLPI